MLALVASFVSALAHNHAAVDPDHTRRHACLYCTPAVPEQGVAVLALSPRCGEVAVREPMGPPQRRSLLDPHHSGNAPPPARA